MPSDRNKSASGVRKPIVLLPQIGEWICAYLTASGRPVDPPMRPVAQLHRNTEAVILGLLQTRSIKREPYFAQD
jgi:hypothetical protein